MLVFIWICLLEQFLQLIYYIRFQWNEKLQFEISGFHFMIPNESIMEAHE